MFLAPIADAKGVTLGLGFLVVDVKSALNILQLALTSGVSDGRLGFLGLFMSVVAASPLALPAFLPEVLLPLLFVSPRGRFTSFVSAPRSVWNIERLPRLAGTLVEVSPAGT